MVVLGFLPFYLSTKVPWVPFYDLSVLKKVDSLLLPWCVREEPRVSLVGVQAQVSGGPCLVFLVASPLGTLDEEI